jgi:hypothetical protein
MLNVSASDILRMHGKWIESNKLIKLVAEKLRVGERQAYRKIKQDKQILRIVLPDRKVLYGLAEFGLPEFEKPSKPNFFIEQCWVELQGISQLNETLSLTDLNSLRAWPQLCGFIARLPEPLKQQLKLDAERAETAINQIFQDNDAPWNKNGRVRVVVRTMIDKVSTALHSSP